MKTGRRTLDCELSTIDSTFVIAGALTAAEYFNRDTKDEREIRNLAVRIYATRRLAMGAEWRRHGNARLDDLKADSSSIVGKAITKR